VSLAKMDIDTLFQSIKNHYSVQVENLRKEQKDVMVHLLKREDVMAILLTGYGKTLTYALTPLLLDEVSSKGRIYKAWNHTKPRFQS